MLIWHQIWPLKTQEITVPGSSIFKNLPGLQWLIQGGLGACPSPPSFFVFFLFFYRNEVYKQKVICKVFQTSTKFCFKMLEMAILETHIFKNFWGGHAPDPPIKLVPLALIVPPPPLKVLDPLEVSHTQQFFNLGISGSALIKVFH